MRYGIVWPSPPSVVIKPQTTPRSHGVPRPLSLLSSDIASANPMLMPAPTDAARPTLKVANVFCVANAAANNGASVETELVHQPRKSLAARSATQTNRRATSLSSFTCPAAACASLMSPGRKFSCRCSSSCAKGHPATAGCPRRWFSALRPRKNAARLDFHQAPPLFARAFRRSVRVTHDGRRTTKTFHVLPPDERDVFPKFFPIQFN